MSVYAKPSPISIEYYLAECVQVEAEDLKPQCFKSEINASGCGSPREVLELMGAFYPSQYTVTYSQLEIEATGTKSCPKSLYRCFLAHSNRKFRCCEAYGLREENALNACCAHLMFVYGKDKILPVKLLKRYEWSTAGQFQLFLKPKLALKQPPWPSNTDLVPSQNTHNTPANRSNFVWYSPNYSGPRPVDPRLRNNTPFVPLNGMTGSSIHNGLPNACENHGRESSHFLPSEGSNEFELCSRAAMQPSLPIARELSQRPSLSGQSDETIPPLIAEGGDDWINESSKPDSYCRGAGQIKRLYGTFPSPKNTKKGKFQNFPSQLKEFESLERRGNVIKAVRKRFRKLLLESVKQGGENRVKLWNEVSCEEFINLPPHPIGKPATPKIELDLSDPYTDQWTPKTAFRMMTESKVKPVKHMSCQSTRSLLQTFSLDVKTFLDIQTLYATASNEELAAQACHAKLIHLYFGKKQLATRLLQNFVYVRRNKASSSSNFGEYPILVRHPEVVASFLPPSGLCKAINGTNAPKSVRFINEAAVKILTPEKPKVSPRKRADLSSKQFQNIVSHIAVNKDKVTLTLDTVPVKKMRHTTARKLNLLPGNRMKRNRFQVGANKSGKIEDKADNSDFPLFAPESVPSSYENTGASSGAREGEEEGEIIEIRSTSLSDNFVLCPDVADALKELQQLQFVDSVVTNPTYVNETGLFKVEIVVNSRYVFTEVSNQGFSHALKAAAKKATHFMERVVNERSECLIPKQSEGDLLLLASLLELHTGMSVDSVAVAFKFDFDCKRWNADLKIDSNELSSKNSHSSQAEALCEVLLTYLVTHLNLSVVHC